ncbi:MAG: ATP-dependent DNA helicase RecG [Parcubacteria group bacterium]|mgnify:CR=1 FL=1|nr:ATP-dependent DNA helicase RecG [Parcubacteria group bacterium]|tara:strand:+ start:5280 stop:7436 length:2157 start_codon:yes stop_codon:yes gene_type:complete
MQSQDELTQHFRLIKTQKAALEKLGIHTVQDLLFHFPSRYEDVGAAHRIIDIIPNETVTVYGELMDMEKKLAWKTKRYMVEGTLSDATGSIGLKWFNQPYAAKMFEHAKFVKVTGKPTGTGKLYFANPTVEAMPNLPAVFDNETLNNELFPVYPESRGVSSRWIYHAVHKILESGVHEHISDVIPEEILDKYKLPTLASALVWIHTPQNNRDARAARKRFSFEEVFLIQVAHQKNRHDTQELKAPHVIANENALESYLEALPYTPTNAQKKSIKDIMEDFKKSYPMSRLLEGDVGSGKTTVAAATMYAIACGAIEEKKYAKPQVAYMVPTEILAKQQFAGLIEAFEHLSAQTGSPIPIGLITGSGCQKFPSKVNPREATKISRAQLSKWVANGEIPIVVGTHALIQKTVQFENLAYVVIDEQHRFGTQQRKKLAQKDGSAPHLLSMTATPIPRTLSLTIYGDLDLSVLDERPKGRKTITTKVVPPSKREDVYTGVRSELMSGRQMYVICPRIEEPDPDKALALRVKSVRAEAKRLQAGPFKEYKVGILHGKMTPKEKDEVMQAFEAGDIDVLVATSVVEVGVNVPNATLIIIEGAERFGLSQLHQLRGRVQRSNYQPYCYLFTDSTTQTSITRLRTLEKASDGFLLAEEDLKLRGSGQLAGTQQWGVSDLGMEALQNIKMVEAARNEATHLIESDPSLKKNSSIAERVLQYAQDLHME